MLYGHTIESLRARCIEDGDCLIWQGGAYTNGSPRAHVHGERRTTSARAVWLVLHGKVQQPGKFAFSTCGNPLCMAHAVFLTRAQIGKRVAALTGYAQNPARRERIALSKRATASPLTPDQVHDIRYGPGLITEKAARHKVSEQTASAIVNGRRWRDYRNPFAQLAA